MADVSTASEVPAATEASPDFLINGETYLSRHPGFELIGRQEELNAAVDVITRKGPSNNLILSSKGGTGVSSLLLGLLDKLTDKSSFFLDVDALFASSDSTKIKEGFDRAMATLKDAQNPVLVIENTKGFLDGISNNSTDGLINTLMREIRTSQKLQTIFTAAESTVPDLQKAHEDLGKNFILQEVGEPSKDDLRLIVEHAAAKLGEQYNATISKEALDTVLDITTKYPQECLPLQPKASLLVLEGAIMATRRTMAAEASSQLEEKLANIKEALEQGKPAEGDLADKTPEELEALRIETENTINAEKQKQADILRAKREMDRAAEQIRDIKTRLGIQEKDDSKAAANGKELLKQVREQYNAAAAAGNDREVAAIKIEYVKRGGNLTALLNQSDESPDGEAILPVVADSDEYKELERKLEVREGLYTTAKEKYEKLSASDNAGNTEEADAVAPLTLTDSHVLVEFSRLSRTPMTKLQDDESKRLMNLENLLAERVVGQDEAVRAVARTVRRSRSGLKNPKTPDGAFLFLGPSGVGKTELCKALSDILGYALHTFDMTQFAEKHAVSKLIGAPPGYDGYDAGGELTNKVRQNPKCINLFDEAEKAHMDVYNILLRGLNDGMLTDNHGVDVSLAGTLNILTSNLGSHIYLDENLSAEEVEKQIKEYIYRHTDKDTGEEVGFRPEFLGRLDGIIIFNKLGQDQIRLIAIRDMKNLNTWLADKGQDITVEMPAADLELMCKEKYDPKKGARSIMKYIAGSIVSEASDNLMLHPNEAGKLEVTYTSDEKMTKEDLAKKKSNVSTEFIPKGTEKPAPQAAANQNATAPKPAASA